MIEALDDAFDLECRRDIRVRRVSTARTLGGMFVVVLIVVCVTVWFGARLLIDAWKGSRLDLAQRFSPYRPSVADEAQEWLERQMHE